MKPTRHAKFSLKWSVRASDRSGFDESVGRVFLWNAAAPSVVTNLGWYATLPSNTVFKIEQDEEIPALQALVRRLHADPSIGREIGAVGRARLEEKHTPSHYVKAVTNVAARFSSDAATVTRASRLKDATPLSDVR